MRDRRYVKDLTIEELEEVLLIRRREERLARMRRMRTVGRTGKSVLVADSDPELFAEQPAPPHAKQGTAHGRPEVFDPETAKDNGTLGVWRERVLLGVEVAALVGLIVVIANMLLSVRNLNQEWREQRADLGFPTPTPTPLIRASILPGGHVPPSQSGGEGRPLGPVPVIELPTPGPRTPTRIVIPAIDVDVNVVAGDTWDQLKKGAGHHIGSANPGERGNCFISGHNDVYGEPFRYLERLKPGDEVIVYAGEQAYRYVVSADPRIVDPDDISVMYPTSQATLTLLTCHPYMVDTHRLVVVAKLAN